MEHIDRGSHARLERQRIKWHVALGHEWEEDTEMMEILCDILRSIPLQHNSFMFRLLPP